MIDDRLENVLSVFCYLQHLGLMFKPADYSHNSGNLGLNLIDAVLLWLDNCYGKSKMICQISDKEKISPSRASPRKLNSTAQPGVAGTYYMVTW